MTGSLSKGATTNMIESIVLLAVGVVAGMTVGYKGDNPDFTWTDCFVMTLDTLKGIFKK
jgi:hypothetical protein